MEFRKYQHIERFGTEEVKGINIGTCYVFPKIDGTNGSVWLGDNGEIKAGSRNRTLGLGKGKDNQEFYAYIKKQDNIKKLLEAFSHYRLYGEWLVPHSLKTYREDAWREFYVFDVYNERTEEYLSYNRYKPLLNEFNVEYIPPLAVIENPKRENLINQLDKTGQYLIEDGKGNGEGIVIKNYYFKNKYGRTTWAKMVTSRFKEKHHKELGAPKMKGSKCIEEKIIINYVTKSLIKKEYSKIINEKQGWRSEYIPMLFGRVFHALVTEETWNIVKKFNRPTIDFSDLRELTIHKIKEIKSELF